MNKFIEVENYNTKSTSVGEVANLIKILKSVMDKQNSSPGEIAEMTRTICSQFNIELPKGFVTYTKNDTDTIFNFYSECLLNTNDLKDRISSKDLYKKYIQYLSKEGYLPNKYGEPDIKNLKTTGYIFTRKIKELHGSNNYKRNLSYKGGKDDVFVNLRFNEEEEG